MIYNELLEKYNRLLHENSRLKQENRQLKRQLCQPEPESSPNQDSKAKIERNILEIESSQGNCCSGVDHTSDSASKIHLFMSLFKGRKDVFAKWWKNEKKGISGYSPVCLNQWRAGICGKPKIPCTKCEHKLYASLDENTIENHLRGNIVAGIYPMLSDETCSFLAMDFDEADWQKDICVVRKVCTEFNIPVAVERSRSGQGGHVWFLFENPVSAAFARRFGSALLTRAMGERHEIQFKSYDRLFPSQDTLPKGGLGNLIALPLQKAARENKNSEFVDEHFKAHDDQWAFLSSVWKISENFLEDLVSNLCPGHELGILKIDEEAEEEKPWEVSKNKVQLQKNDFPGQMDIVKANMLFVPKAGLSQKALNRIKRFASFKNPMFYKQQAMRLPTYGHSRVICCADETKAYLCLPRGCEIELTEELQATGTEARVIDNCRQ
ncbi:MAG: hypothetical protein K9J83_00720 [Desulfarculaceae bacterium]|nr:hypothetical protein [Desulfarculaceae bacterium]